MNMYYSILSLKLNQDILTQAINTINTDPNLQYTKQYIDYITNNPDNNLGTQFNSRAFLVYSIFADLISQSRIIISSDTQNTYYARHHLIPEAMYQKYRKISMTSRKHTFNNNKTGLPIFDIEMFPHSLSVQSIIKNKRSILKYNKYTLITTEQLVQQVKQCIDDISKQKYPEFLQLFNNVAQTMTELQNNQFTSSPTLEETFSNYLQRTLANSNSQSYIIQEASNSVIVKTDTDIVISANGATKYYYFDSSQSVSAILGNQKGIDNIENSMDFYYLVNSYPYAPLTTSRSYIDTQFNVVPYRCEIKQYQLVKVPDDQKGFFAKIGQDADIFENVTLCIYLSQLPTAVTQNIVDKPDFQAKLSLGTFDYISSKRLLFSGTKNYIPGIHQPDRNGIDDQILIQIATEFRNIFGSALEVVLVPDFLKYEDRNKILQGQYALNNESDFDIVVSGVFVDSGDIQNGMPNFGNVYFGRNYIATNITFLASMFSACGMYMAKFTLNDYTLPHSCFKTQLKFCVPKSKSSADFFNLFTQNYFNPKTQFVQIEMQTYDEVINGILKDECDIAVLYDIDAAPYMAIIDTLTYRQYPEFQRHLAPIIRSDIIDLQQMNLSYGDKAPTILFTISIVITLLAIIISIIVCVNLRQWIKVNNSRGDSE
ncbi:Hypothetical_protein [Hexamita inflata]|uniref:Hypothetical_protein n=1 Tax=Hexamita inflata TaxID=28002 RepID=A0AA86QGI0_9EUKA|nr:Hypothetical protein HINF_LOCUS45433 [Hexamita inflata]